MSPDKFEFLIQMGEKSSSLVAPSYRDEEVWVRQWSWELYQQDLPCWKGQKVGVRRRETPKLMPEAESSVAA